MVKKLRVCSGVGRARGRIVGRYVGGASSSVDLESPFSRLAMASDEIGSAIMVSSATDHSTLPRSDGTNFIAVTTVHRL